MIIQTTPVRFDMETGRYPLHEAAKAGNGRLIKKLLKDGVDPNQKDKDGRTPLHYAILGAPTVAYASATVGHISAPMSHLNQLTVSPSPTGASALKKRKAIFHPRTNIKKPYSTATPRLEPELEPPKTTTSPAKDSNELFEDQVCGVVPTLGRKTYYEGEARGGYTPTQPPTPSKSSDCVYTLLINGTNINANVQDNDGRTPLHLAAQSGWSYCVCCLLTFCTNVDANIQDNDGRTPLHLAAQLDALTCVYFLLTNGTNIDANVQDKDGRTPLHLATMFSPSSDVISLLTNSSMVDRNILDKNGHAPFHVVCSKEWGLEFLKLLECGADPSITKSKWGSRPDSRRKTKALKLLKLWENAANGFKYQTLAALVDDTWLTESHTAFSSVVWEWEIPAVLDWSNPAGVTEEEVQCFNPAQQVVLLRYRSYPTMAALGATAAKWMIRATTFAEALTQVSEAKWSSLLLELLDLVKQADLSSGNSGMFFV